MNPAEIAREAFKRLAARRIAPTPDAYREIYNDIAGIKEPVTVADNGAENVLLGLAQRLSDQPGEAGEAGRRLHRAVKARDWAASATCAAQMLDKQLKRPGAFELAVLADEPEARLLREMLSRTLMLAVASLLAGSPTLVLEAESLGTAVKTAYNEPALNEIAARLKQLCYQIEIRSGDMGEQQELLLRLFRLLLDNVNELLDDGSWLRGQVEAVQELIAGPIDQRALEDAMRSLKEVIYKQGQLKHSLSDVKITVKNMMMTFIDRLGSVAATTGDFHDRMGGLSEQISRATDIAQLNSLLDEVLRETRAVQAEALTSRDRMMQARQQMDDAGQRIHELEAQLQHMSELVREDQLTGSLNRRGLDDVLEREARRADRRGTPLCIAMLDLDDFKRLNDTFGHFAGDMALKHLVQVVRKTLRSIDAIARLGGEEFMIVLPETTVDAATQTMVRLQRELTRHFFMHDNEKVLITFSAGVALRLPDENAEALLRRADQAMYRAKNTGKNRVVVAD